MMRAPRSGQEMGIPQVVRASGAVAQEERYHGELPVQALERLRESLATPDAVLQVRLQAKSLGGYPQLSGSITGRLPLQCRRCDKLYEWPLDVHLLLRLVENEDQERALMQDSDPYWVQDDQLPLREIIEEEVMLALPMLPRCETCENIVQAAPVAKADDAPVRRENPFAALKERFKK